MRGQKRQYLHRFSPYKAGRYWTRTFIALLGPEMEHVCLRDYPAYRWDEDTETNLFMQGAIDELNMWEKLGLFG